MYSYLPILSYELFPSNVKLPSHTSCDTRVKLHTFFQRDLRDTHAVYAHALETYYDLSFAKPAGGPVARQHPCVIKASSLFFTKQPTPQPGGRTTPTAFFFFFWRLHAFKRKTAHRQKSNVEVHSVCNTDTIRKPPRHNAHLNWWKRHTRTYTRSQLSVPRRKHH